MAADRQIGSMPGATPAHPVAGSRRAFPTRTAPKLLFLLLAGLAAVHGLGTDWAGHATGDETGPLGLLALCVLYTLVLALPFVPALEIGLLVMALFGAPGAVIAWIATVAGLNIAYGLGRHLGGPPGSDGRVHLPPQLARHLDRLARTRLHAIVPVVTLGLLLNLPGNTAFGGGGGIAMLYGATHSLSWPAFLASVAAATSVLPLLFLLGLVGAAQLGM